MNLISQPNRLTSFNGKRLSFVLVLSLLIGGFGVSLPVHAQRIEIADIPSPRANGAKAWVSDLTSTLSTEGIEYINRVGNELNEGLGREMAVVVVGTTSGRPHRAFATQLFNTWGVGKRGLPGAPGVWRNNGVLIFVAINDRQVELVLGDGIDGREMTRVAEQIVDDIIVPNFKAGDPNSALYEGSRAVATRIFSITDIDAPPTLPSVSGEESRARRRKRSQKGPINWFPYLIGGGAVCGVGLLIGGRYYARYRPRQCQKCQNEMVLLSEEQDDQFLNPSEQLEESLGSVDYDVWACLSCEEVMSLRYGSFFTSYSTCPYCSYVTVYQFKDTLVQANYSHGGSVRVTEDCQNCDYYNTYVYRTPKLTKSSSSSSSSSFGGGGGGGSGFSGGSSSGGGASGSW